MAKIIQAVAKAPANLRLWNKKRTLKTLAVKFVQNAHFIERAGALKLIRFPFVTVQSP